MPEDKVFKESEVSEVIPKYMEIYSEEVNTDRAIPALEDGLKPVHRRILWSAHENKLGAKSKHMKLARLSGDVIGKLHPHSNCLRGDTKFYLRDGSVKTIKEMYDETKEDPNKKFDVYAIDKEGLLNHETIHDVRIGQYTNKVYHIKLTNGMTLHVTSNHPIKRYNGKFTCAEDLQVGNILTSIKINGEKDDYPYAILNNNRNRKGETLLSVYNRVHAQERKKNDTTHHINENKWDNSDDNLIILSRSDHQKIHAKEQRSLQNLIKGRETMFGDTNPFIKEQNKIKNQEIARELGKHNTIRKALAMIKELQDNNFEVNNFNYVKYRDLVYQAPSIDTLIREGYIKNNVDELKDYHLKLDFSKAIGLTGKYLKDPSRHKGNGMRFETKLELFLKTLLYGIDTGMITFDDLKKHNINNEKFKEIKRQIAEINHISIAHSLPAFHEEFFNDIMNSFEKLIDAFGIAIVESIDVEELDEKIPMYDFTGDKWHNSMICDDSHRKWVCVHNSAVEQATCTLAQTWTQRLPFIDPQGSIGDIWGNGPAAARYLEVRMSHSAELMLKDIDKDASEMVPNYDNTEQEPVYLPSSLPNALINANSGIGYGMSTNIIPHNPVELLNAAIEMVKNPDITDEELIKIVPGPDFPTGGQILKDNDKVHPAMDEMKNGQASFVVRGHISIEQEGKRKKKTLLVIDEIPYGTNAQRILDQVSQIMIDRQKLLDVESVGNESIDGKLRIVIRMNDDSKIDIAKSLIYRYSDMETRVSCQNNMLVDGRPKIVNIHYYLKKWLEYRRGVLSKIIRHDQNDIAKRLNIINGLLRLVDNSDDIIKSAKESNGRQNFIEILMNTYQFNEQQANAIASLPLYRLGKQDTQRLTVEKENLESKFKDNENILNNKDAMDEFMIQDMNNTIEELKNDNSVDISRKTQIVDEFKSVDLDMNKLDQQEIKVLPIKVVIRTDGIMHRMTPRVYDNNIEDAKKIRPIIKTLDATTVDWIMAFTNDGTVITRFANDLENINPKYDIEGFYKQVPSFKSNQIFIGGAVFNDEIRKENPLILSITQMGLAKLSELQRSMPNTSNRGYLKRTTVYNGIKNRAKGDEIAIATVVSQDDVKNKKIHIELNNGQIIEHDLSDISVQGQGGSGGHKVPGFLRKDIKDWSIIDK